MMGLTLLSGTHFLGQGKKPNRYSWRYVPVWKGYLDGRNVIMKRITHCE